MRAGRSALGEKERTVKNLLPRIVALVLVSALLFPAGCGTVGPPTFSCQARCFEPVVDRTHLGNTVTVTAESAEMAEAQCNADSFPDGPGCPAGSSFIDCVCQ
jgi:hypothetical protein